MRWLLPLALAACTGPGDDSSAPDACVGDPPPDAPPDERTGVLVVGSGMAGMSAAYEAELAGVPYVLVEREDEVGGTTKWAGGQMLFAGTTEQAEAGVVDSPDALLAEWADITGGDPDAPWVRQFATSAVPEVHDWLVAIGTGFSVHENPDEGSVHRLHQPEGDGPALLDVVSAQLDPSHQRLGREVTALVCDGGRVTGARWRDVDDGDEGWTEASAVVVATGGFLRDLDRVREARAELSGVDLWYSTSPLADGNGIDLVEAVGGTVTNLGAVALFAHGTPDYRRPGEWEELGIRDLSNTLWVDTGGSRFLNEQEAKGFDAGDVVAALPGGVAWSVWDADVAPQMEMFDTLPEDTDPTEDATFDGAIAAGEDAFTADTVASLADAMGVPAAGFQAAVDAYAEGTAPGADAMGKSPELVDPLDHAPYYAFRVVPVVAKGFGGVAVDLDGAVVDAAGVAIPGLYAAGELTGMAGGSLVGDRGFSGSLSAVILSGRIAGRSAAEDVTP